ncbi:MAG: Fe-S cluster protein, partial [Deltaproteobacteria bacterium]|nr:Fe-S cluster protein [Deltaproteobacteria bacterium]
LHCIAHLERDVGEVLPYLNSVLGGFEYLKEPPAVTFKAHGKIITVHPRKIAINALRDEGEADRILEWLKREINGAWEKRHEIQPSYEGAPRPKIFEILKLLPRTNCRQCGQPTCTVFATLVAQGAKSADDCPDLSEEACQMMDNYMAQFQLDA